MSAKTSTKMAISLVVAGMIFVIGIFLLISSIDGSPPAESEEYATPESTDRNKTLYSIPAPAPSPPLRAVPEEKEPIDPDLDYDLLQKIDFNGVKLLMTEKELTKAAGQGERRAGCIGCVEINYPDKQITVFISGGAELYHGRKTFCIDTTDSSYPILGTKVEMPMEKAKEILMNQGFEPVESAREDHLYAKGNLNIIFYDDNKDKEIEKIRVEIALKMPEGAIY